MSSFKDVTKIISIPFFYLTYVRFLLVRKLVFDNSGNLLTKENPDRVCSFLMPNMTVLINAFFENFMNGRDPNEVMFNTTGCFDTGPACGGWGHVTVRMTAELIP